MGTPTHYRVLRMTACRRPRCRPTGSAPAGFKVREVVLNIHGFLMIAERLRQRTVQCNDTYARTLDVATRSDLCIAFICKLSVWRVVFLYFCFCHLIMFVPPQAVLSRACYVSQRLA